MGERRGGAKGTTTQKRRTSLQRRARQLRREREREKAMDKEKESGESDCAAMWLSAGTRAKGAELEKKNKRESETISWRLLPPLGRSSSFQLWGCVKR